MMAQRIPLLLYHSITDVSDPRFAHWAVSPELFAGHMDHLASNGYRTLTIRELVDRVFVRKQALEPRSVAITFDDGFEDFYSAAWPQLQRNSLTATVFVTTSYVDRTSAWLARQGEASRPLLSLSQIEELSAAGIECGAHGHTHVQLDTVAPATARREIEDSKRFLEAVVGTVSSFAYPHGYYTRRVQRLVERAGFVCACAVKDALSTTSDDRYALARVIVSGGTDVDGFARMLRGEDLEAAPRDRPLRRGAWRAVRRAGGEPLREWLAS